VPLPDDVPGRLYATGFTDVGPDPDAALDEVQADTLLCLLTDADIAMRFPRFSHWLDINAASGRAWRFPIEDGGVADDDAMAEMVTTLVGHLRRGRGIVTHCGAGIGRTALACGLAVVALSGQPLQTALIELRAARSAAGPENPHQRAHLERLAARLQPG
jgi:hypothetical protein